MKDEYDFSKAEQGKFYVPVEETQMPVYLDQDVLQFLIKHKAKNGGRLDTLVNDLLRKDMSGVIRLQFRADYKDGGSRFVSNAGPDPVVLRKWSLQRWLSALD